MMCGEYVDPKEPSFYFAINMHWQPHELALPRLPKGQKWQMRFSTTVEEKQLENEFISIAGRSCILYESVETL